MRRALASFLVGGCVLSTAIAFQARGDWAAAGKVCSLLARDLVIKAETAEGRKLLERSELIEDWAGMIRRENGLALAWSSPLLGFFYTQRNMGESLWR